jgi:hypothetical protein
MKSLHDDIRITSWGRFEDPGVYPSGAGGSPLRPGPSYPEEIEGFQIYEITPEERAKIIDDYSTWPKIHKEEGLSMDEHSETLGAILAEIQVDDDDTYCKDFKFHMIDDRFILVVPTLWSIGRDDYGCSDNDITEDEIKQATNVVKNIYRKIEQNIDILEKCINHN